MAKVDTIPVRMEPEMKAACIKAARRLDYAGVSEFIRRECVVSKLQEMDLWPPTPGAEEPSRLVDTGAEYSAEVTE